MKLLLPLFCLVLFCSDCRADAISRAARAQARADRLHAVASAQVAYHTPVVQYVASPVVTYSVTAPVIVRQPPVVRVYVRHWFW